MTHMTRTLTTTIAIGTAAMLLTSGAALAAKRVPHHRVVARAHPVQHRYIAYRRGAPGDFRNVYPVGSYGTVDELYGYPPGGIIARRTLENQQAPGLASELDYTTKQTATGGPVGGPLFGGGGR